MHVKLLLAKENEDRINALLSDGNWVHTDYYEIDSGSQYFGCANVISISKQITTVEEAALLYIWQRIYAGNEPTTHNHSLHTSSDLLAWLLISGYIGSGEGVKLSPQAAWKKVQEIIQDRLSFEKAQVYKNGHPISIFPLPANEEAKSVIAFKDTSDDHLYFIETATAWLYFNGGTAG